MDTAHPVYLDYNATTPVLPEAVEAMLPFLRGEFGNPSSQHPYGRRAREAVEAARERVARLLGSAADEIVFTGGGTEANNLAIFGATRTAAGRRHIISSAIEHLATAKPLAWLEREGWRVTRVEVDGEGRARLSEFQEALGPETALVTVMYANNETGVLQPVVEMARLARAAGAITHTDTAQVTLQLPVRVDELGIDLLSVAGHKLYAPKGVGALYVRRGTGLTPFALGAGHERGLRPGTENVAGIVALGVACEHAAGALGEQSASTRALRDELWRALAAGIPGLALNGHEELRLPNTLNVRFPGVSGNAVLAGAPEVAASTGSACHDGHETASGVILAMGVDPRAAAGSVRLSLGRGTTRADIEVAAAALVRSWRGAAPTRGTAR